VTEWKRDVVAEMSATAATSPAPSSCTPPTPDPLEQHNLTDTEPTLAGTLERRLAGWADGITAGTEIHVDDATSEQLRALGYLT
jgi:hypothetical protein